jgi:hypothetical protein
MVGNPTREPVIVDGSPYTAIEVLFEIQAQHSLGMHPLRDARTRVGECGSW